MAEPIFTPSGLDALPPVEMARKAEQVGVVKAGMSTANTFALAVLAGAFIALGAIFATTVTAGGAEVPFGVLRLLGGLAFSLGLILVVVAGAELFTGNNLIVMAWAGKRVRTVQVARNWTIVYLGNFVGAVATAVILFVGKQYEFGGGAVGVQALSIAAAKTDLGFAQAIALGALCNAPRLPRRLAVLQRANDDRQDPLDHPTNCGVRRSRLRALRREHVLHPDGPVDQERRRVRVRAGRRGP